MAAIPVVTLRPRQRTTIALPFREGSGNFRLLKAIRGERTRPEYNRQTKLFEVARDSGNELVDGLVDEFGSVHVIVHGNSRTTCVWECWDADPNSRWDCVCGCAGANHGSGHPIGKEVEAGLSVLNEHVRAEYVVTRRGWMLVK